MMDTNRLAMGQAEDLSVEPDAYLEWACQVMVDISEQKNQTNGLDNLCIVGQRNHELH